MAVLVALDSLGWLVGHNTADCGSAVGDGGGGGQPNAVNDSGTRKRYEGGEDDRNGNGDERWNCHLKEWDGCAFLFFIEREREKESRKKNRGNNKRKWMDFEFKVQNIRSTCI